MSAAPERRELTDPLGSSPESPPPEALCRVAGASESSESPRPGEFCGLPARNTVDAAFRAQALRTPHAIALIEARQHVSFSALDDAASHLALWLAAAGVVAGDRVGVCLPRSMAYITCVLAILRNHAVFVPLDSSLPLASLRDCANSTPLKLVLHADVSVDRSDWLDVRDALSTFTDGVPAPELSATGPIADAIPAYILYTSGSTGRPKAVIGSHLSILNRARWARHALALSDDDVFCLETHPGSVDHVAEMFQPLLTGGSLVIPADIRDTSAFVADLANRRVTQLTLLPLQLEMLLAVPRFASLYALRSVVCSGDTLPWDLARRFFDAMPHVRLFNVYGLTETGADSSCYEIPYDGRADYGSYFANTVPAGPRAITRPGVPLDDLRKRFNDSRMPLKLSSLDEYRQWLEEAVLPCTVDVSSGKFVGHMTSALPDFMPPLGALVARLNQNMVKIETSKALTLLERQLLAMLHREVFNCVDYEARTQDPEHVFGLVVSGGSTANLTALWNARNGALLRLGFSKDEISRHGAFELLQRAGYTGFAIIASRLAHYSIRKSASLLGIGEESLLHVKLTDRQTIDIDDLERTIQAAKAQRRLIIAMIGIAGATETGIIDPLAAMAQSARAHGVHFHVDAAWGGAIVFSDRHRALLEGIQHADSVTLCPHKQLYVPQGMSLCLFRDTHAIHASSVQAAYQGRRGSFDTGQYTIEGSRPANFLFLHAIFHLITRRGIGALVDRGIEMTRLLADTLAQHEAFELVSAPTINILNYRYIRPSLRGKQTRSTEAQRQISRDVAAIQARQFLQGETFVSRTEILDLALCDEPITVFRVVIANPLTTPQHLLEMLADQLEIAATITTGPDANRAAEDARLLLRRAATPRARVERYAVPIGKSIANTQLLALGKDGQVLPEGVVGEIHVGGSGLSLGYLGARATAEAFVPHPFLPGERLFRTRDFGRRLSDGNFELVGRKDQQVKIRGMRVELTDIETSLRCLEGVRQCVVLAEPGHGDTILVAFVVPSRPLQWPSTEACARALRHQLLSLLPPYMIPDVLHVLDALPLQAGGKVDRQRLRTLHRYDLALRPQRAESATETTLRAIWEHLIGRGRVDPADDFFEVGGDSIAALTLREEIRRELGVELTLRSLFEHPRLEEIASRIDEMRAAAAVA
jgi:putative pyridoxal-dependent aspartate 1-decarboxylase